MKIVRHIHIAGALLSCSLPVSAALDLSPLKKTVMGIYYAQETPFVLGLTICGLTGYLLYQRTHYKGELVKQKSQSLMNLSAFEKAQGIAFKRLEDKCTAAENREKTIKEQLTAMTANLDNEKETSAFRAKQIVVYMGKVRDITEQYNNLSFLHKGVVQDNSRLKAANEHVNEQLQTQLSWVSSYKKEAELSRNMLFALQNPPKPATSGDAIQIVDSNGEGNE